MQGLIFFKKSMFSCKKVKKSLWIRNLIRIRSAFLESLNPDPDSGTPKDADPDPGTPKNADPMRTRIRIQNPGGGGGEGGRANCNDSKKSLVFLIYSCSYSLYTPEQFKSRENLHQ